MVGVMLQSERERQRLTIQDVARATSIRVLYIEAIENGDYAALPAEVYTKGFVRNYANFLKMDADACVKQYMLDIHSELPVPDASEDLSVRGEKQRDSAQERSVSFEKKKGNAHHQNQNMLFFGAAAILIVLLCGAFFVFSQDSTTVASKPVESPKIEEKAVDTSIVKETSVKEEAKPQEENKVKEAPKTLDHVEVVAKFTDRCWTSVSVDGNSVFEGTIEDGKVMTWEGKENITITAGNAGAIEASCNGKDMGRFGNVGEVVEKVFQKDALQE